ncbi:hypothetical protein NCAS_0A06430 [Naumovozyma castellii]|uniref:alpha-1,2-Mannosidase n=1 Tax=Naumovozyma castellii TaxID=27288 RepID=G0V6V5_NAUCA|nr:hypothetical protein NCAS_0A06430 [Naumovozyma castellii CBS 4309]CCC67201.1 hypothetical protein NCAS_0A06430 [Naumovozyma castellii CBS 4309]
MELQVRILFIFLAILGFTACESPYSFTKKDLRTYRDDVKELFEFGLQNYLDFGYPYDEVRPVSCEPKTRNFDNPADYPTNDVLGNFTATLIDSLTTVAIMGDMERFLSLVNLVKQTFPSKFDVDSTVQLFESTIRILGSLISSHLYATDPRKAVYLRDDEYDGFLLELAVDIADRLLPAYLETNTGLPIARINLKNGMKSVDVATMNENNLAGMATPMFEFTMLSYLTHDRKYSEVTRFAYDTLWEHLKSTLGLLPESIDPYTLQEYSMVSGVGASSDSYYEYALKGAILFNDDKLMDIWEESYKNLKLSSKTDWFYANVMSGQGSVAYSWIDALGAFFPGVQVLAGDVDDAILKHTMYLKLWNTFGGIPERWQFDSIGVWDTLPLPWYPLRPEFIESTYYLYRATKDPFYLNIGHHILNDFKYRFRFMCGFAGRQDLQYDTVQDRMETFVLSETLKYLYLLFDEENELNHSSENVIFSTEAHPMWLTTDMITDFENNNFFDDELYKGHLEQCKIHLKSHAIERQKQRQHVVYAVNGGTVVKSYSHEKPNILTGDAYESVQNETHRLNIFGEFQKLKPGKVCSSSYSLFGKKEQEDIISLPYSKILSEFGRLFEIDYRYNETLNKPEHLEGYRQFEIEPAFYSLWAETSGGRSTSQLPATTESFDMIFDLPGKYARSQFDNGDIYCDTLQSRRKMRVEKLFPGSIDVFGKKVNPTIFADIDRQFLHNPHCDGKSQVSPSAAYRVTVVDGLDVPEDAIVVINRGDIVSPRLGDLYAQFGYNKFDQVFFGCIPFVNVFLE